MAIRFKPRKQLCRICNNEYLANSGVSLYCKNCKKLKIKEWRKIYKKSIKGKLSAKRYNRSEAGKAHYKKYRAKPEYKEYSTLRYKNMPKNIYRARYYIHNAIRDGKLIKPENCENCGIKDWGEKRSMIEAHHYRGYEPEFWLVVQWLCTNCHKEADVK